jgi:hypothetical protein
MTGLDSAHFSQNDAQRYAQTLNRQGYAPVSYGNDDDSVACRFYMRSVIDPGATEAAGGLEKHREVEFVELRFAGGKSVYDQPSTEEMRKRFWRHYDAFLKNRETPAVVGTPLEVLPWLTRVEVDDLRAFRIYTLEQMAAMTDQQVGQYGPLGRQYRERAQAVMKAGTEAAPLLALQKQIEAPQDRQ